LKLALGQNFLTIVRANHFVVSTCHDEDQVYKRVINWLFELIAELSFKLVEVRAKQQTRLDQNHALGRFLNGTLNKEE
jgi:hypothetical protein